MDNFNRLQKESRKYTQNRLKQRSSQSVVHNLNDLLQKQENDNIFFDQLIESMAEDPHNVACPQCGDLLEYSDGLFICPTCLFSINQDTYQTIVDLQITHQDCEYYLTCIETLQFVCETCSCAFTLL